MVYLETLFHLIPTCKEKKSIQNVVRKLSYHVVVVFFQSKKASWLFVSRMALFVKEYCIPANISVCDIIANLASRGSRYPSDAISSSTLLT